MSTLVHTGGYVRLICKEAKNQCNQADYFALFDPEGNLITNRSSCSEPIVFRLEIDENLKLGQYRCEYRDGGKLTANINYRLCKFAFDMDIAVRMCAVPKCCTCLRRHTRTVGKPKTLTSSFQAEKAAKIAPNHAEKKARFVSLKRTARKNHAPNSQRPATAASKLMDQEAS